MQTISPSSSCFSRETSLTTSPLRTSELIQTGSSSVEEMTYFGRLLSVSAHAPSREFQREPKYSSLRRPISNAVAPRASSSPRWAHASVSPFTNCWNQPPCLEPSSPVGSPMTPSSETFSLITILPIAVLPSLDYSMRRYRRRKLSGEFRAAPTS